MNTPKRTDRPAANCPFCGGVDTGDMCSDKDSKAVFHWVQCSNCEACGPTDYDADNAVKLWDRRLTADDFLTG